MREVTAAVPRRRGGTFRRRVDPVSVLAFTVPLLFFLSTIAPTVYNLDSAELTTASYSGGLLRATGYPLYLLIGRAWSRLPLGDVGFRMNLLSAVCGAMTILLGERILRRLGVGPWAALGALGLLCFSKYFWALSLIAEVYTLHTLLICVTFLALLRWQARPGPWPLAVATFVVGLSFGNQVATVLLAPACLWYVLATAPRSALHWRSLLAAATGLLLGLSVYLYLPLAFSTQPEFNYAGHFDAAGRFVPLDLTTLAGMWWLVSGHAFMGEMFAYRAPELWGQILHFAGELWRAFLVLGVGPAIVGIFVSWRRSAALGGLLSLAFLGHVCFYVDYRVLDKDTMFLPAYLIWALWLGFGYQWLLDWVGERHQAADWRLLPAGLQALRLLIAGAVVVAAVWTRPLVNLSADWSARQRGEAILDALPPGTLFFGWWDSAPVVQYLQVVEGKRRDVQAVNRFLVGSEALRSWLRTVTDQRPVFFADAPDDLMPEFESRQVGPVFKVEAASRRVSTRH